MKKEKAKKMMQAGKFNFATLERGDENLHYKNFDEIGDKIEKGKRLRFPFPTFEYDFDSLTVDFFTAVFNKINDNIVFYLPAEDEKVYNVKNFCVSKKPIMIQGKNKDYFLYYKNIIIDPLFKRSGEFIGNTKQRTGEENNKLDSLKKFYRHFPCFDKKYAIFFCVLGIIYFENMNKIPSLDFYDYSVIKKKYKEEKEDSQISFDENHEIKDEDVEFVSGFDNKDNFIKKDNMEKIYNNIILYLYNSIEPSEIFTNEDCSFDKINIFNYFGKDLRIKEFEKYASDFKGLINQKTSNNEDVSDTSKIFLKYLFQETKKTESNSKEDIEFFKKNVLETAWFLKLF